MTVAREAMKPKLLISSRNRVSGCLVCRSLSRRFPAYILNQQYDSYGIFVTNIIQ